MAGPPLCFSRSAAFTKEEEEEGVGLASDEDAGELATLAPEACCPMAWLKSRSVTAEELMVREVMHAWQWRSLNLPRPPSQAKLLSSCRAKQHNMCRSETGAAQRHFTASHSSVLPAQKSSPHHARAVRWEIRTRGHQSIEIIVIGEGADADLSARPSLVPFLITINRKFL